MITLQVSPLYPEFLAFISYLGAPLMKRQLCTVFRLIARVSFGILDFMIVPKIRKSSEQSIPSILASALIALMSSGLFRSNLTRTLTSFECNKHG